MKKLKKKDYYDDDDDYDNCVTEWDKTLWWNILYLFCSSCEFISILLVNWMNGNLADGCLCQKMRMKWMKSERISISCMNIRKLADKEWFIVSALYGWRQFTLLFPISMLMLGMWKSFSVCHHFISHPQFGLFTPNHRGKWNAHQLEASGMSITRILRAESSSLLLCERQFTPRKWKQHGMEFTNVIDFDMWHDPGLKWEAYNGILKALIIVFRIILIWKIS